MKKVLFVSYGGGHANIASLVYKKLEKNFNYKLQVLALTVAGAVFKRNGIPYINLSEYLTLFHDKDLIIKYGEKLAEKHFNPNSGCSYEDTVAYFGFGYRELVEQYGAEEAEYIFADNGRTAFCPVSVMKTIIEYEKPDALVITCGVRSEKAAGLAANSLGIPVIRIADLPTFEENGCECVTCVMNEYAKKYAINNLNLNPKSVIITGQPVFENNLKVDSESIDKVYHQIKGNKFHKFILYLSQPGLVESDQIEKKILEISDRHQDWIFVIKLHPNQDLDENIYVTENVYKTKDIDLKALLYLCDVAITKDSTTGLEAVLIGKPLINILLSETRLDYSEYGISVKITDLEDLDKIICECVGSDSMTLKRLKNGQKNMRNHKNAAANIADVIRNEMIKNMK